MAMGDHDYHDYYEALGLEPDSSQEEIDGAYQRLTDYLEGDSVAEEIRPWAERQLALVEEAYSILGNPSRRHAYDGRQRFRSGTPPRQVRRSVSRRVAPDAPASSGGSWRALGALPMAVGGLIVGLVTLLFIAAGTGNWDKVTGLFQWTAQGGGAEAGGMDTARVSQLEAMVALDPANTEAMFELGEIYVLAEEWAKVIMWHGRVLEADPVNTHSMNDIALAYFYLGFYAEARPYWDRALELEPANVTLHYALAFALLNTPPYDWTQAKAHFQTVVDLEPGTDTAQSAQEHIEAIEASLANATPGTGG